MKYPEDFINKIICGDALEVLKEIPDESVNCGVCSPPYWSLRDYGLNPVIWDGDKNCKHEWIESKSAGDIRFRPGHNSLVGKNKNPAIYPIKHRPNETNPGKEGWYKDKGGLSKNPSQSNFCSLCGAWRGSLGLEPTFKLYIKHLCDIFDEIKRVLRKDGTCWVNIGDSYGGFQGKNAGWPDSKTKAKVPQQLKPKQYAKSLLDIPYRFSTEMTNRGWIKRNTLIWWKPNCMPSSANDRFTVDFEYIFFFTKNNKAQFWTNEKTLECVDKKPLGIKGLEGRDWECKEVGVISENSFNVRVRDTDRDKYIQKATGEEKQSYKKPKLKKVSLWTGHDYWFEQQFEEYTFPLNRWGGIYTDGNVPNSKYLKEDIDPAQITKRPRSFRPNLNGRNKRAVWAIPTRPFPEAHFAVYPEGLIETPIKAGCPEFVCKKCGKARVKIYERQIDFGTEKSDTKYIGLNAGSLAEKRQAYRKLGYESPPRPNGIGYTDCGCNAGWEGGIVLDPFMGAGTTVLVALKQRKRFIGIEIKQEYIDMANKRIAKVQQEIF